MSHCPPSWPRSSRTGSRRAPAEGDWVQLVVAAVHRRARVVCHGQPAHPRPYVRAQGQVISLDVLPGEVRAMVQGSGARPYRITIGLAVFPELVWAKAEIALSEQALPCAKLLAGEVPPELEELFAAAGAPLFPSRVDELDMRCSCPDWEVPCKHLAATFYLLAEAFDDDPFLILRWRGRHRETLLGRLRELRADSTSDGMPTELTDHPAAVAGTALALTDLTYPGGAGDHLDRFGTCPLRCRAGPPT